MNREWVEAGALAIVEGRALYHPAGVLDGCRACSTARIRAECAIDAVESLIRADERTTLTTARYLQSIKDTIGAATLADLRAKVEGLAVYIVDDQDEPGGPSILHHAISLDSVLALIDEAQP